MKSIDRNLGLMYNEINKTGFMNWRKTDVFELLRKAMGIDKTENIFVLNQIFNRFFSESSIWTEKEENRENSRFVHDDRV